MRQSAQGANNKMMVRVLVVLCLVIGLGILGSMKSVHTHPVAQSHSSTPDVDRNRPADSPAKNEGTVKPLPNSVKKMLQDLDDEELVQRRGETLAPSATADVRHDPVTPAWMLNRPPFKAPSATVAEDPVDEGKQLMFPAPAKEKGKNRAASWPFVTGDGFRSLCAPYIYDEKWTKTERMESRQEKGEVWDLFNQMPSGTAVFVQTHMLNEFIDNVHRRIFSKRSGPSGTENRFQYVLVTHNSDFSSPWDDRNNRAKFKVTSEHYKDHRRFLLGEKGLVVNGPAVSPTNAEVLAWYGQNLVLEAPRLFALPIGIENRYNKFGAHLEVYFDMATTVPPFSKRSKLLFVNFDEKTNRKERLGAKQQIQKNFLNHQDLLTATGLKKGNKGSEEKRNALRGYLGLVSEHQFILAPHGHGVDTHRFWEALYMGCVPITLKSAMDSTLLDLDLPVLLVESYDVVTPDWLKEQASHLRSKFPNALTSAGDKFRKSHGFVQPALGKDFWVKKFTQYI